MTPHTGGVISHHVPIAVERPSAQPTTVAGEAAFRQALVETRDWNEQIERNSLELLLAELERLRKEWLADLKASGELLRQAGEIRSLAGADRLDPVLSGQVLSHLVVLALDEGESVSGEDSNRA